jgi:excinuclease UvrABC nuclease subunit
MKEAARNLDFEKAAAIRDRLRDIRKKMLEVGVRHS